MHVRFFEFSMLGFHMGSALGIWQADEVFIQRSRWTKLAVKFLAVARDPKLLKQFNWMIFLQSWLSFLKKSY